ncbi:MAG: hypothetical protein EXR62_09095 [Chloroflexi bacterium]|nr:hypothetical protein [Chloroflexota bacterium]
MFEFLHYLMDSNLVTAVFVIGALAVILAIVGPVKTVIEISLLMRFVLALFGLALMGISLGSFVLTNPPERFDTATRVQAAQATKDAVNMAATIHVVQATETSLAEKLRTTQPVVSTETPRAIQGPASTPLQGGSPAVQSTATSTIPVSSTPTTTIAESSHLYVINS